MIDQEALEFLPSLTTVRVSEPLYIIRVRLRWIDETRRSHRVIRNVTRRRFIPHARGTVAWG